MPIIEVKAFERRFQDPEQSRLVIERLTDALVSVYGESVRSETWGPAGGRRAGQMGVRRRGAELTGSRLLSTSLTSGETAVPRIVGGHDAWFELADGRQVIDASNTAAPLGHGHPEIVEAVRRASSGIALNEGWACRRIVRTPLTT